MESWVVFWVTSASGRFTSSSRRKWPMWIVSVFQVFSSFDSRLGLVGRARGAEMFGPTEAEDFTLLFEPRHGTPRGELSEVSPATRPQCEGRAAHPKRGRKKKAPAKDRGCLIPCYLRHVRRSCGGRI